MNFFSTLEFKVGALVLAIGGLIAFMSLQVSDDPSYMGRSKKAWFLLPNASGLIKGSAIRSAGIPVGVIKDIRLQDGQARVDITIRSDVGLTRSGSVSLKANGILGDKYVEVYPGSPTDPALEEGGQILNIASGGGLDDVMSQVADITKSLKDVAKNLNEAVAQNGTDAHILGRIVRNVEKLTGDIAQITSDNKEQISEIVTQVHDITSTLDGLINDESDTGFKKTWKNSMARIDSSLKNIEEITSKINRGEGTLGKLISDEKTAEDVSTAVEGISGLIDSANRITTAFDFNGHYLNSIEQTKTAIGIQIQPGLDRFYYLGLITDPAGVVETSVHKTTTNTGVTQYEQEDTYKTKNKFTALYGKNFYDFTVRAGMIENTGGVGLDYHMFRHKLTASLDAYSFSEIQARAALSYRFKHGLYVMAGYNDMFDKKNARSVFAGAGLFLTNDDLKLLLTRAPF